SEENGNGVGLRVKPRKKRGLRVNDNNEDDSGGQNGEDGEKEGARNALKNAEDSAVNGGLYNRSDSARDSESEGFKFTGSGKSGGMKAKGGGKFKIGKKSAGMLVLFLIAIMVVGIGSIGSGLFTIGGLDYGMQDAMGVPISVGVVQEQTENIIAEEAEDGNVTSALSEKLASAGIMVGQVTDSGDFVRTNTYIADVEKIKDLAVLGNFQIQPTESGELAFLYDNEVINASDFVVAVDSNPVLYAAISDEVLKSGALHYYSETTNDYFKDSNVTRSAFEDWDDSGTLQEREERYLKKMSETINNESSLEIGAITDTRDDTFSSSVAEGITGSVADGVKADSEDEATRKGAQLMNAGVSAGIPYQAMSSCMWIEEALQMARLYGEGPVHETLNFMNKETTVKYYDVHSGEEIEVKDSILTTPNYVSAVSAGRLSPAEAATFARDSIIQSTGVGDAGLNDTVINTDGQNESTSVLKKGKTQKGNEGVLGIAEGVLYLATGVSNSDVMASIIGGNRIFQGCLDLNSGIDQRTMGAMGADAPTLAQYHQKEKEIIAKQAAAERATRSPFDLSSRYTFFGSIAHNLAITAVKNRAGSAGSAGGIVGAFAELTGNSVNNIASSAIADGNDNSPKLTFGEYCPTVNSVGVEGTIYCSKQTALSTEYMSRTADEWKQAIDEDEFKRFTLEHMERMSTIGVKDAGVCDVYDDLKTGISAIISAIGRFFADLFGIYEACDGVPSGEATGSDYTYTSNGIQDAKKLAAYARYDYVKSLLDNTQSHASRIREEYYAKHPKDYSREGFLARISGMSKEDATIALAYADRVIALAEYNPLERYAFSNNLSLDLPEKPLVEHASQIASEMYVFWRGRTEYDDLRNRVMVA
ncbi:hypothetical protein IKE99_02280, partial [Candidatus Saccharibacteria bacterium]|nr:hypothetical protein [Candidatus Saccharibacteria bacterium]